MTIELKRTTELIPEEWLFYSQSFNQVFDKTSNIDDFKHKYFKTIDGFSYHSLLKQEEKVVGCCTIIPYEYYINSKIIRVGLAVDVFIIKENRDDPYSLYNMYEKLKKELIVYNISLIIAVPNDTSYPYWKNIVKWKDVGYIRYYALPVKLGNVISKMPGVLNRISLLGAKIILVCSFLIRSTEKLAPIRMNRSNSIIEKQRYTQDHNIVNIENVIFSYRIVNEDGINTCYLIDFYDKTKRIKDSLSLRKAIHHICYKEKIDLIIFVGKLSFTQMLLFRVPFKSEPKHLYFMAEIINPDKISNNELLYNIENWDFGLFNYDVR